MLESVALPNPPALEPKANLKSPKDSNAASATSAFAVSHEELAIRVESRDGDVLEVRRTLTVAAGYSRSAFQGEDGPGHKGPGEVEAGKEAKDGKGAGAQGAMEWVRKLADEVEKQQVKLLETLLKDFRKGQGAEETRFVMIGFSLVAGEDEVSGVPDYWNAENTSDRIVDFATSFAGIFGDDPEFAETMVNAVAEGFKQANAVLGELPGAAGKLNRDTRDLVFGKLDKWLEEWRAGAYNQSAQTEITEAALAAA